MWHEDALWFSSSLGSRKIRNLQAEPRCSLSTEDGDHPLVVEGRAEIVTDLDRIAAFLAASNAKYKVDYGIDFLDPAVNASVRVAPDWAFALDERRSPPRRHGGDSPRTNERAYASLQRRTGHAGGRTPGEGNGAGVAGLGLVHAADQAMNSGRSARAAA